MADILKVWDEATQQWVGIPAIQGETAEEGADYIKFPGGTLICWGYYYGGTVAASAVGSMYRAAITVNAVFPVPFVDMPHVSASNHNGYGIMGEIDVSPTGIQTFYLLRPNSGSIYPRIYWTAIGRWK